MRRLLIRPGAIGDFILSLPALKFLALQLKALQSQESLYTEVWCARQNVPLARFCDHARAIPSTGLDRIAILPAEDVIEQLEQFDEIHSWYGTQRPDFRTAVSALPFTFHDALPPSNALHATAFYCAQVGAPLTLPSLPVTAFRENFCIIHPFASNFAKRWPLVHFRRLATNLENVNWCAGPEESLEGATRIPDLFELAKWLARARIFIGNDSGITHLAAAVGTPVVAIFGPTDPAVWAPRGPKVRVLRAAAIHSITTEEVLAAVQSLL